MCFRVSRTPVDDFAMERVWDPGVNAYEKVIKMNINFVDSLREREGIFMYFLDTQVSLAATLVRCPSVDP